MRLRSIQRARRAAAYAAMLAGLLAAGTAQAQNAYIANFNYVSVIDTRTNGQVGSPIAVSRRTYGVAAAPDGSRLYVTNRSDDTVSVIDTATGSVVGDPIPVGDLPLGVAITPDGTKAYITNVGSGTVSVIATGSDRVLGDPIPVGIQPGGVAVTPDGSRVYVANTISGSVSVIDARTDKVVGDPIQVGATPIAFGLFIQAKPPFAGTPGAANCAGQSLSAEARRYGGTSAAARALGYETVAMMQTAIRAYCAG